VPLSKEIWTGMGRGKNKVCFKKFERRQKNHNLPLGWGDDAGIEQISDPNTEEMVWLRRK